jgi:hypothetical protein
MSITEGLRVGDVVRHSRTMDVEFAQDGYVQLVDRENQTIKIGLFDNHKGTDKIEVVEKAKPKVGDVITGADLKATQWEPGTVFLSKAGKGWTYMMNADGKWVCPRLVSLCSSNLFRDTEKLKLLHVA